MYFLAIRCRTKERHLADEKDKLQIRKEEHQLQMRQKQDEHQFQMRQKQEKHELQMRQKEDQVDMAMKVMSGNQLTR